MSMAAKDSHLDHRLRRFVDRARVDCEHLFEYRCPMYWGTLMRTDDREVRYCRECSHNVYLVTTESELAERARRGECVAIVTAAELPTPAQAVHSEFPPMAVGRVAPRYLGPAPDTDED